MEICELVGTWKGSKRGTPQQHASWIDPVLSSTLRMWGSTCMYTSCFCCQISPPKPEVLKNDKNDKNDVKRMIENWPWSCQVGSLNSNQVYCFRV